VAFIYARFGVAVFESTPYVPRQGLCALALLIITEFYEHTLLQSTGAGVAEN